MVHSFTHKIMIHANTIKAAVRKAFPDVTIGEIKRHKFGMFTVSLTKEMPRSTKKGFVMGETADLDSDDMVVLDKTISWA